MGRPRILQIHNDYVQPGGETRSVGRIRGWLGEEFDIELAGYESADWAGAGAPSRWQQALRMMGNRRVADELAARQGEWGAEAWLVHNLYPVVSPLVLPTARKLGVPVIHYVHNFRPMAVTGWAGRPPELRHRWRQHAREVWAASWQGSRLRTFWHALVLERAHLCGWYRGVAHWVAISDAMRAHWMEAGVPGDKVSVLRHAWEGGAGGWPEGQDGDYYLYLGRLEEAKGLGELMGAWRILGQGGGVAPRLVIAGEGLMRGEVERLAGGQEGIDYVGQVDGLDKDRLLAGCRGVLVPSAWPEPLGMVVYEGWHHGKLVVAARSGGLAELIGAGDERGLGHPPCDAAALAAAVLAAEALGLEGRKQRAEAGRRWLLAEASVAGWRMGFRAIWDKVAGAGAVGGER